MKSGVEYVIRSERIAKARMIRWNQGNEKIQPNRGRNGRWKSGGFRIRKRNNTLKEQSDSTKSTAVHVKQSIKKVLVFSKTVTKNAFESGKTNLQNKPNHPHINPISNKKITPPRTRQPRLTHFVEDGFPWTEQEMRIFEEKYEEILFDNSINVSPKFQTDLSVLDERKFKSYRTKECNIQLNKDSEQFKAKFKYAQDTIKSAGLIRFTESQIHSLSLLCQTTECFEEILRREKRILSMYFELNSSNTKNRAAK